MGRYEWPQKRGNWDEIMLLIRIIIPFITIVLGGSSQLLVSVVNNRGDRRSPSWGCGIHSKWPFHGLLTN